MNRSEDIVAEIAAALASRQLLLSTCESCTGGWIAKCLTDQAGSSKWYAGGLVTYSDALKRRLAGVRAATLKRHGAVSEAVAAEMAAGCARALGTDFALAVSGIAGPAGGSAGKPVGTVCFGWRLADGSVETGTRHFDGDRDTVRRQSVAWALAQLRERLLQRTED